MHYSLAVRLLLLLILVTMPASGQVLISENFNGSGLVDQSIWRLPFGGDGAFFGRTEVKTDLTTHYPSMSNGVATLELDTFRDDGTGGSTGAFHGAGLHTKRNFGLGGGLRFEARARLANQVPGLDGGLFLFDVQRTNAAGDLVRDEIDHELLTNDLNRSFTNIWNDGSFFGADGGGDPQFHVPSATYTMTDFHDYRIDWLPNKVEWYVDDVLIRTRTTDIPDDPMNFRMNLWAPDSGFSAAFNAALQPAASAAQNETYQLEIDNVEISQLNTTRSANLLLDSSFDQSIPYFNLSAGDNPNQSDTGQWVGFNNQNFSNADAHTGANSLAMFGPFSGSPDASGIFQVVDAVPGELFEASVFAKTSVGDSIKGQANFTTIKVEFLDSSGNTIPGLDTFLGANAKESIILEGRDPNIPENEWVERQVNALAPSGTAKAKVSLLFVQLENGGGAAFFDDLSLVKLTSAASIDGDFNDDGVYNCSDVDALVLDIAANNDTASFDLTGDGTVDGDDLDAWLGEAGAANLSSGNSFLDGDANLDGNVDGQDFVDWNSNKFQSGTGWCSGDFNANGAVDGQDFVIWNSKKFTSADVAAVPEPTSLGLLLTIGLFGLSSCRFWGRDS